MLLGGIVLLLLAIPVSEREAPDGPVRAAPTVMFVVILSTEMIAGVEGRYPFGGEMRHQFLLLVFALLAVFVALDWAVERLPKALRDPVLAICAGLIVANCVTHRGGWLSGLPEPFLGPARTLSMSFPQAREIHVDQFSLIAFFAQHHDWDWKFAGRDPNSPFVERYELVKEQRRLLVVAHRDLWNMDFKDPKLYTSLAEGRSCITVFSIRQPGLPPGVARMLPPSELRDAIPTLAREAGLTTVRLIVRGNNNVFADFCPSENSAVSE